MLAPCWPNRDVNYGQSYLQMLLRTLLSDLIHDPPPWEGSLFESNSSVENIFNSVQHKAPSPSGLNDQEWIDSN